MEGSEIQSVSGVCEQYAASEEYLRLKDENSMLRDKIAHLQSQLEESENEAVMAAEIGQQLLEEKSSVEADREQERNTYTAKLEELTQENFSLTAKLESKERLLELHSQYQDDENKRKKEDQEKDQLILLHEKKINELKNDLKKAKITYNEEVSNLNMMIQQKGEVIENLQNDIVKEKEKNRASAIKISNDGEIEELKMAIECCYQDKRQVEHKLCEMIHENERKSLEVDNIRQRLMEVNEELGEERRQKEDYYQHLQDAKDTVNELNLKNNSQQMELNSRGHSKKGNSLFAELEDKRIAAEKELAVFKLRYDSLRKAHNNVKHEMVQMRYQVLGFLQSRSGDRADRLRVEQLESALSAQRAECAMISAKLRQLQHAKDQNPVNEVKEAMESFQGSDSSKHYVNLLLVNAEEMKQKIEMFEKELGVARFRLVAKEDQLHETERKLYTATTSAEKFRNESLRIKLKVDEMKSKYEAEREKVVEHEHLLNELGIIDRSRISQNDFGKIIQEKKLVLPRYMQPTTTDESNSNVKEDKNTTKSSRTEEEPKVKLRRTEKSTEGSKAKNDEDLMKWITTEPQLPKKVLTEKELNEKCCRLLRNTLPKDLAEKYVKQYQDGGHKANAADENSYIWQRKTKAKNDPPKPRKVSFKDEVDVHEIDKSNASDKSNTTFTDEEQISMKKKSNDSRTIVVDDTVQEETCKVQ